MLLAGLNDQPYRATDPDANCIPAQGRAASFLHFWSPGMCQGCRRAHPREGCPAQPEREPAACQTPRLREVVSGVGGLPVRARGLCGCRGSGAGRWCQAQESSELQSSRRPADRTDKCTVPESLVGFVMGKERSTVQHIAYMSRATIECPTRGAPPEFVITGPPLSVPRPLLPLRAHAHPQRAARPRGRWPGRGTTCWARTR
jgi:hypothetical protein